MHGPSLYMILCHFNFQQNMTILDEEEMTMEQLTIEENSQILIEGTKQIHVLITQIRCLFYILLEHI